MSAPTVRECAGCGVVFRRPKGITNKEWGDRAYCKARCRERHLHRLASVEVRVCANPQCGKAFSRPPTCGDERWAVRRHCDQQCAVTAAHARALDWHVGAACRASWVDPELFFPVSECGKFHDEQVSAAKLICDGCPVRARCLEWAVAAEEPYGIFGGATAEERRRMMVELAGVAS